MNLEKSDLYQPLQFVRMEEYEALIDKLEKAKHIMLEVVLLTNYKTDKALSNRIHALEECLFALLPYPE